MMKSYIHQQVIFYFVSNCNLRETSLDIQPQSSNRRFLWQLYVVTESPSYTKHFADNAINCNGLVQKKKQTVGVEDIIF